MDAFFIECRTGCTCCASNNKIFGPFLTLELAKEKAESLRNQSFLSSQYAPNGIYNIHLLEMEEFQDKLFSMEDNFICYKAPEFYYPDKISFPLAKPLERYR